MKELEKVYRIISREVPGAPHDTLLVIDATTGQNGMNQAVALPKRQSNWYCTYENRWYR